MKYRTLGRTGLRVSEVGFGGAGIGHVWGETTDAECIGAIHRALDLGINLSSGRLSGLRQKLKLLV